MPNLTGPALAQYLDLLDTPHLLDEALRQAIGIGCIHGSPVESARLVDADEVLTTPDVVFDINDFEENPDFDDMEGT